MRDRPGPGGAPTPAAPEAAAGRRRRPGESGPGAMAHSPAGGECAGYEAALAYLYGLTDWERRPMDRAMREQLLLARPAALLARLGEPHRRYRTVLVAGTKGKGSTAAMLAGILQAAGYRTGLYSQPHLHTYRERIRVDGALIGREEVVAGVRRIAPHVAALHREQPELGACTTYEAGTALALDYFARCGVEVAVLEVGLGGRLDATNVVPADLSVITSISFDHMAVLGATLPEIAREKAGIIKPGVVVLSAPQRAEALAVLEAVAAERGAPLALGGRDWRWQGDHGSLVVEAAGRRDGVWGDAWRATGVRVPLLGAHQLENAATAIAAAHALTARMARTAGAAGLPPCAPRPLLHGAIAAGVAGTRWPARMEVVAPARRRGEAGGPDGPVVVVDGAHNGDSAEKLAAALRRHVRFDRLWLVMGVGADKDLPAVVGPLAALAAGAWTAAARHPRSRAAQDVAAALAAAGVPATAVADTATALRQALCAAGPRDAVCVTGSLFIAAEAREALGLVGADERDPEIAAARA